MHECNRGKPDLARCIDQAVEGIVVKTATYFLAWDTVRTASALRKPEVFIPPSGLRSIWLHLDLANPKTPAESTGSQDCCGRRHSERDAKCCARDQGAKHMGRAIERLLLQVASTTATRSSWPLRKSTCMVATNIFTPYDERIVEPLRSRQCGQRAYQHSSGSSHRP